MATAVTATYAQTVTTPAQTNITSVGTLTNLRVSGTATATNIVVTSNASTTATTNGALVVSGGVGIAGGIITGGAVDFGAVTSRGNITIAGGAYLDTYRIESTGTIGYLWGSNVLTANIATGASTVNIGYGANVFVNGGLRTAAALTVTNANLNNGINVTYTPYATSGQAIFATGGDTQGGTGYFDFLKITSSATSATNVSKTFRVDNSGTLQILNSAYTATIFSVTDRGFIAVNIAQGVTNGIPGNNAVAMNSNSYIYDDGNYHLTSKAGSIWINANDGSNVNINTQVPSGTMPGGLNVQGAITSQGSGTAATSFISGVNAYSGVALQLTPNGTGAANQAIRDTSSVSSNMYFDVNTGGSAHGQFQFRSSNAFSQLLVVSNSAVTVNRQMLIGGGSQGAYVTISGTNSYTLGGPYGYLNSSGAGTVGGGGNSGNVGWSLQCIGRIQVNEIDATSDERLKDIQGTIPLDRALQFVRAVDGILYTWKPGFGDEGIKSGFGAQSVHKAGFDHMVAPIPNDRVEGSTDADGFTSPDKFQLTLNYLEAIPYHHEVIKHLLDKIEQLEKTVAELKAGK
jgi:hypothetical protein